MFKHGPDARRQVSIALILSRIVTLTLTFNPYPNGPDGCHQARANAATEKEKEKIRRLTEGAGGDLLCGLRACGGAVSSVYCTQL